MSIAKLDRQQHSAVLQWCLSKTFYQKRQSKSGTDVSTNNVEIYGFTVPKSNKQEIIQLNKKLNLKFQANTADTRNS